MSKFSLAPEAAQDIEEIVRHIAEDNFAAALEMEDRFIETFRMLAKFPNSGHSRKELAGDRPLLFFATGKYLVLYQLKPQRIEIAGVLHAARDIPVLIHQRASGG